MVEQQMSTTYSASLTRHIIGAYHKQSITKRTVDDMYVLSLKEELSPHALQAGERHTKYCGD